MSKGPSRSLTARSTASWQALDPKKKNQLLSTLTSYRQASGGLFDWTLVRRLIDGNPFSFEGHDYLRGIYREESALVVVRKAAQMGASEYAISRALHFAVTHGGRVIYFFPSDNDVGEFSRDRFAPAVAESEYLTGLVRDTDTAGLKQIGLGTIYFRGTNSRVRMKSVPGDFLVFDELDEMTPANVELARKRLGHSEWGWELDVSTPSMPGYGIDGAFLATDQRHWLLRCPGCSSWRCLEDEFEQHHGNPEDPRHEICFVQGEPGAEDLVCTSCGHKLDPAQGAWVAKYPDRPQRGYHVSKFASTVLSQREREMGAQTKPAALLAEWCQTDFPGEFYNSELGLPYLPAEGGLSEQDLLELVGPYGMTARGKGCVMGVDQGNGLHVVVKEPHESGLVFTVRVHHEPRTDPTFSHLDHFMAAFDVRAVVIDGLPNTHAARAFAQRFPGRVWLSYYGNSKGRVNWSRDPTGTPVVNVNRTEQLDAWRDAHKLKKRRIPRVEDQMTEFVRQMTNILRSTEEDPVTGQKTARWIKRGPDHFAHADSYAEVALGRLRAGVITATVLG